MIVIHSFSVYRRTPLMEYIHSISFVADIYKFGLFFTLLNGCFNISFLFHCKVSRSKDTFLCNSYPENFLENVTMLCIVKSLLFRQSKSFYLYFLLQVKYLRIQGLDCRSSLLVIFVVVLLLFFWEHTLTSLIFFNINTKC